MEMQYTGQLNSHITITKAKQFLDSNVSSNEMAVQLTDILQCSPIQSAVKHNRKSKRRHKKWFDKDCFASRKQMFYLCRQIRKVSG